MQPISTEEPLLSWTRSKGSPDRTPSLRKKGEHKNGNEEKNMKKSTEGPESERESERKVLQIVINNCLNIFLTFFNKLVIQERGLSFGSGLSQGRLALAEADSGSQRQSLDVETQN